MASVGDKGRVDNWSHCLMYWLYYIHGGFYWCPRPPRCFRYFWYSFSVFILVVNDIFCFPTYVLALTDDINVLELLNVLWTVSGTIPVLIVIPVFTYIHRESLELAMEYVCNGFRPLPFHFRVFLEKRMKIQFYTKDEKLFTIEDMTIIKYAVLSNILITGFLVLFQFINVIDILLWNGKDSFRHQQRHVLPIAYADQIPSFGIFLLMSLCEMSMGVFTVQISIANALTCFVISCNIQNIASSYCKNLRRMHRMLNSFIENHYFTSDPNPSDSIESVIAVYEQDLIEIIKRYSEMEKIIRAFAPFMNFSASILILSVFWCLFGATYSLIQNKYEIKYKEAFKISQIIMLVSGTTLLIVLSYTYQIYFDIKERIGNEVYNLPWYFLPPSTRKVISIFLWQISYPLKLRLFQSYPCSIALVLRVLNLNYSYGNLLASVTNK